MPATLGLWMVHTDMLISVGHTCLQRTCVYLWGQVHTCPSPQVCELHVCIQTSLCFQCVNTRESPLCEGILRPVSGWEPRASEELTWGQDLGHEASGCLSPGPLGHAGTNSISLASWWECHVGQNHQPPWNQDRWQLLLALHQWSPSLYHWRGNEIGLAQFAVPGVNLVAAV